MDQRQQIADRLKQANNILVTVSNNPSVDQLASCIGLTLALNKLGKHATAVFSGAVPSTIEFLQPEKTIEANTDSLRDFIISLDKSKADKLRYKVEDKVVKIFITPYRTSISDKDLNFSQGDFNVDVVIALGVHNQTDLDQAITSHGRILHDAAVVTINVKPGGELGSINWLVPGASSLSELITELVDAVDRQLMDGQIATALLTGIVAETHRFSNEKTSPDTMSISAELMAAGANQQLVATKLDPPKPLSAPPAPTPPPVAAAPSVPTPATPVPATVTAPPAQAADGTLEIAHPEAAKGMGRNDAPDEAYNSPTRQINIDEQGGLHNIEEVDSKKELETPKPEPPKESIKEVPKPEVGTIDPIQHMGSSRMILQPPSLGDSMSAADPFATGDPLSLPQPDELPSGSPPPSPAPFASPTADTPGPAMPFMPTNAASQGANPATPNSAPPLAVASEPVAAPSSSPALGMSLPPPPMEDPDAGAPPDLAPTPPMTPSPFDTTQSDHGAPEHLAATRDAVQQAIASQPADPAHPGRIEALNAQPLGDPLREPLPPAATAPVSDDISPDPLVIKPADSMPPPPGPPPMMPPLQP